jgi:hypothetical protein
MDDSALWLKDDLKACLPHSHTEVCIFIVGGAVAKVEASDVFEEGASDGKCGPGAIVDFTRVTEQWIFRVATSPEVSSSRIAKDDTAGLLEGAIRVDELGPDGTHSRVVKLAQEWRKPTWLGQGICVEEEQDISRGFGCSAIAAVRVPHVGLVADRDDALVLPSHSAEHVPSPVTRRVVHDNDFDVQFFW